MTPPRGIQEFRVDPGAPSPAGAAALLVGLVAYETLFSDELSTEVRDRLKEEGRGRKARIGIERRPYGGRWALRRSNRGVSQSISNTFQ